MKQRMVRFAATAALFAATACSDFIGLGDIDFNLDGGSGCCFTPIPFDFYPSSGMRVLTGDTVRFRTYSDSGFHTAKWVASGVFRIVEGDSTTTASTAPGNSVLVRVTGTGDGRLRATSTRSAHDRSHDFKSVDSSAVARIDLGWAAGVEIPIARRDSLPIYLTLCDAQFRTIIGQPTVMRLSDTTRARLVRHVVSLLGRTTEQWYVKPLDTGRVVLSAEFRTVGETVSLRILP